MNKQSNGFRYEFGVLRQFGGCDIGSQGLSAGWAAPEEAHVWNDGTLSVFKVIFERPKSAAVLTFEGQPFVHGACASQDVTLFVNGFFLGFWRLTEAKDYRLSVTVQPEQFSARMAMPQPNASGCCPKASDPPK